MSGNHPTIAELHFYHVIQPIVDLTNNTTFGYEMLLRSKEVENPEIIFKYAKEQHQLYDLDMYSIHKAFDTINQSASLLEGLHLFINIFPSTIGNTESIKRLRNLKSNLRLSSNKVVFEITEAKKEKALTIFKDMVVDIKEQDFLIALDDFGKGDSSFPHIIELEPHIVKMDRYFSKDLACSPKKQKVIESMINLFDDETIYILEGIETASDLHTAKELGVRYAQGYYLGRPKPVEYYLPQDILDNGRTTK